METPESLHAKYLQQLIESHLESQRDIGQFVLNHLKEVNNGIGGVIAYKLVLTAEETGKLMRLIDSK